MTQMPQIGAAAERALHYAQDDAIRRAAAALGGGESAAATLDWARANLPPDEYNARVAALADPHEAPHAAAQLKSRHASGVRDSTIRHSISTGGYEPSEVKAGMARAAAGDAEAIRRLKATPDAILNEGMGINPDSACPPGMCTL